MYVLGIGTSKLPDGTNHVAYSPIAVRNRPGAGPYTLGFVPVRVRSPPGLSLSSSGVISGTPSPRLFHHDTAGTFAFGVSLTEGGVTVTGNRLRHHHTLTPEKLSIPGASPVALPDASLNVGYSQSLTAMLAARRPTPGACSRVLCLPAWASASSGAPSGPAHRLQHVGSFGFTAQVKDTSGGDGIVRFHDQRRMRPRSPSPPASRSTTHHRRLGLPRAVIRRSGRERPLHVCGAPVARCLAGLVDL